MIRKDECAIMEGCDGWKLYSPDGDCFAFVSRDQSFDEDAARELLHDMVDHYNRGHEDGETIGQDNLRDQLRFLLNAAEAK